MNTAKIKSYAKINLTLDIVGEANGYHLLDSFVASLDLYDLVVVRKRKDKLISVTMRGMGSEGISPEENNAAKAGEAFVERFGTSGANIAVYKNIPLGAGLGGSSADAAGVLNGMAKLYGISDSEALGALADRLGSDTRYMLKGGFCRMQGRGEKLFPLPAKGKKTVLFSHLSEKFGVCGRLLSGIRQRGQFICARGKKYAEVHRRLFRRKDRGRGQVFDERALRACGTAERRGEKGAFGSQELFSARRRDDGLGELRGGAI